MLFQEDEFRPLLWIVIGGTVLLVLMAIFVPPMRIPVLVFVICSNVVILLLMFIAAFKTGSLPGLKRRRSGGGGGFGGRAR